MIEFCAGKKKIYGLDKAEKEKIKEDLTFENPNYFSVLKYSKWNNTKAPKYLKYYTVTKDYIEVPMGYEYEGEVTRDDRISLEIEYPSFALTLRPLQEEAVNAFKDIGSILLKTGEGKSITGLYLAGKLKQRALIVVNKDDLVDGWMADAKLCYGDIEVGLVKGKVFKIGEQITITTIQTLSRLGEKKLEDLQSKISMLIIDELHRAGAKSYQVLNSFPTRYRLGLTATKMRNDGLVDVVDLICGKTVFDGTKGESDAIIPAKNIHIVRRYSDIKWSPKKHYYNTKTKQDVHDVIFNNVTYTEGTKEWYSVMSILEKEGKVQAYPLRLHFAYEKIANDNAFNYKVCQDIKQAYNKGLSCVVFCKTVEHLDTLYDMLVKECPKIQKFYGNMKDTKAEVKRRAESKEVLITLATIAIACEGTNVKAWQVGFLADTVANEKDLIQILGRLRRTLEGKDMVYFFDYRHPYMVGIKNHGDKRDQWYKNLGINS